MTCVVGLEDKGQVWLGSDSYLGTVDSRDILDRPKWFRKGILVFAYAGDIRIAQIVEHGVVIRQRRRNEKPMSYLTSVAKVVYQGAAAAGISRKDDGADFLVVLDGLLYTMQSDYSVIRSRRGYAAIGVGSPYVLGAMAALKNRVPPRECLTEALGIAADLCPQVAKPMTIECFS